MENLHERLTCAWNTFIFQKIEPFNPFKDKLIIAIFQFRIFSLILNLFKDSSLKKMVQGR